MVASPSAASTTPAPGGAARAYFAGDHEEKARGLFQLLDEDGDARPFGREAEPALPA